MKTSVVKSILERLDKEDIADSIELDIEGNNYKQHFSICGDNEWSIEVGDVLKLDICGEIQWIDTDSIQRIIWA